MRSRPGAFVVGIVAAVSLAVSSCSGGLTSPADELADEPDVPTSGWMIDPPADYERCAITVPSALSISAQDATAALRVYGDADLDDPYAGPLYGIAVFDSAPIDQLPLGDTEEVAVDGAPGFVGGAEGFQLAVLPDGAARVLSWELGDGRVAQLAVRRDADVDLVALAEGVSVGDDGPRLDASLLRVDAVDLGDLYQLEGRPRFRFGIDFQRRDEAGGLDDQMTLVGAEGDEASMEAFRFRAAESARIEIDGRPGVAADIGADGEGPWVVTWLTEEGLILRLFSFRTRPEVLQELAESARVVEDDEWATLLDELDPGTCGP